MALGGQKLQPAKRPDAPVMFRVAQRRQIIAQNAPLEHLTETLTWLPGRPVLDRTGLKGSFDYNLAWPLEEMQVLSQEARPPTDGNVPSLAGALQERKGLGLRRKGAPWI